MVGMFDNKKTNPEIIRNLKELFIEKFQLSKETFISVAELRCHEENCPPIETVFTVSGGGSIFLCDALYKSKKLKYISCHNEQAVSFAAESYSRFKNKSKTNI